MAYGNPTVGNPNVFNAQNAVQNTLFGWVTKALGKTLAPDTKEGDDKGFVTSSIDKYLREVKHNKYTNITWKGSGKSPQQVYGWRWTDTRLETAMRRLNNAAQNSQLIAMIQKASTEIAPLSTDTATTSTPSSKTNYG